MRLTAIVLLAMTGSRLTKAESFSWENMETLWRSIVVPDFPEADISVTDYGAMPDGKTDSSEAFRKAIQACSESGGGRVVASGGVFKTGPIHLKSNVNLHVAEGTTLSFFTDPEKYLPAVLTRYEGVEVMNYSPLVYAYGQKNIALTGKGTLDGNADESNWWAMTPPRSGKEDKNNPHTRALLFAMADEGVPVAERRFGPSSKLRPNFVEPYACENVLI